MTSVVRDRPAPAIPGGLRLLLATVVLYLAFGKGFAYAGYPPVFVGEVVLLIGVMAALSTRTELPRNAGAALTAGMLALGAIQAVLDVSDGRVPILEIGRGLAPLYYGLVAFAMYALLRDYERRTGYGTALSKLQEACCSVAPCVVVIICVLAALHIFHYPIELSWPGSDGPMVAMKATDQSVALMVLLPLLRHRAVARGQRLFLAAWWVAAVLLAFTSRAALLALVAGGLLVVYRSPRQAIRIGAAIAAVTAFLYFSGLSFGTGPRQVSMETATAAVRSLLDDQSGSELPQHYAGTKRWRQDWWSDIWSDVVEEKRVLHGSGWGDNMAIAYGILPSRAADDPRVLRLPHNFFLAVAGRAGLVMGVGFYVVAGLAILRRISRDERDGPGPLATAARAGLGAAVVVSLSDVYIESPQGGFTLWALVGLSWWLHASHTSDCSGSPSSSSNQARPEASSRLRHEDTGYT